MDLDELETVARALQKAHYERGRGIAPPWEMLDKFEHQAWGFSARAALLALARPQSLPGNIPPGMAFADLPAAWVERYIPKPLPAEIGETAERLRNICLAAIGAPIASEDVLAYELAVTPISVIELCDTIERLSPRLAAAMKVVEAARWTDNAAIGAAVDAFDALAAQATEEGK